MTTFKSEQKNLKRPDVQKVSNFIDNDSKIQKHSLWYKSLFQEWDLGYNELVRLHGHWKSDISANEIFGDKYLQNSVKATLETTVAKEDCQLISVAKDDHLKLFKQVNREDLQAKVDFLKAILSDKVRVSIERQQKICMGFTTEIINKNDYITKESAKGNHIYMIYKGNCQLKRTFAQQILAQTMSRLEKFSKAKMDSIIKEYTKEELFQSEWYNKIDYKSTGITLEELSKGNLLTELQISDINENQIIGSEILFNGTKKYEYTTYVNTNKQQYFAIKVEDFLSKIPIEYLESLQRDYYTKQKSRMNIFQNKVVVYLEMYKDKLRNIVSIKEAPFLRLTKVFKSTENLKQKFDQKPIEPKVDIETPDTSEKPKQDIKLINDDNFDEYDPKKHAKYKKLNWTRTEKKVNDITDFEIMAFKKYNVDIKNNNLRSINFRYGFDIENEDRIKKKKIADAFKFRISPIKKFHGSKPLNYQNDEFAKTARDFFDAEKYRDLTPKRPLSLSNKIFAKDNLLYNENPVTHQKSNLLKENNRKGNFYENITKSLYLKHLYDMPNKKQQSDGEFSNENVESKLYKLSDHSKKPVIKQKFDIKSTRSLKSNKSDSKLNKSFNDTKYLSNNTLYNTKYDRQFNTTRNSFTNDMQGGKNYMDFTRPFNDNLYSIISKNLEKNKSTSNDIFYNENNSTTAAIKYLYSQPLDTKKKYKSHLTKSSTSRIIKGLMSSKTKPGAYIDMNDDPSNKINFNKIK